MDQPLGALQLTPPRVDASRARLRGMLQVPTRKPVFPFFFSIYLGVDMRQKGRRENGSGSLGKFKRWGQFFQAHLVFQT